MRALEIGTANNGGLALWLAQRGYRVDCLNLSNSYAKVQEVHQRYQVESRVSYQVGNALDLTDSEQFDIIAFKSVLGGIAGRHSSDHEAMSVLRPLFLKIKAALKPGGVLIFADNLAGSPLHRLTRRCFVNWSQGWHYLPLDRMPELLSELGEFGLHSGGMTGCMGRREWQRSLLASLDQKVLERVIPSSWHYFCYGWARAGEAPD